MGSTGIAAVAAIPVGRIWRVNLTAAGSDLFGLPLQGALHPLPGLWRQRLRVGLAECFWMVVNGVSQEANLLPVPAAPLANQEMQAQPEAPLKTDVPIEGLRL
jgi:hypothetical protein